MADKLDHELAFLKEVSRNHLDRAKQLADTEWKVSFVFWTAIGATSALGVANVDKIGSLVLDNALPLVIGFQLTALGFLFGFCRNNHVSLTTERGIYQYFQNEAAALLSRPEWTIKSKTGKEPANKATADFAFVESLTWGFKALTTLSIVNASFSLLYWTAWYAEPKHRPVDWAILALACAGPAFGICLAFSAVVRQRLRWFLDPEAKAKDRKIRADRLKAERAKEADDRQPQA